MTLAAGSLLYKSADPQYYKQGLEFETSTYNYGTAVKKRSGRERADFDEFISKSKATGEAFFNYLVPAIQRLNLRGFEIDRYLAAFREHVIERVRQDVRPDAPRRRESIFACSELSHVERFHELAPRNNAVIVNLHVIRCDSFFEGDMAILDGFDNSLGYDQARVIVENYWRGQVSEEPCPELLVQGHFQWGAPV